MSDRLFMELYGCMTSFIPIQEEQVTTLSGGKLNYPKLYTKLEQCGLTITSVVHDPGRKIENTYYADYERGVYGCLNAYLAGKAPNELHRLSSLATEGNTYLRNRAWRDYYIQTVPLPMWIYDFSRRMRDIGERQVFDIWLCLNKRISYSNGMWSREVLEYVFDHAPEKTSLPDTEEDGMVTLYRGMGAKSLPAEEAISWTTKPWSAMWFAHHSGHGTGLVTAEITPDEIVAYLAGNWEENEVLVRPGTVRNIRYEDMIPVSHEKALELTTPTMLEFAFYGEQARKLGYRKESLFHFHGLQHVQRVLILSLIFYYNSGISLTEEDKWILVYFSLLHDVARLYGSGDEEQHGAEAVKIVKSRGLRVKHLKLSKKDYRIAHLIIRCHSIEDTDGLAAIRKEPGFSKRDRERAELLLWICKDMDALDRLRFGGLDYRLLRTEYAKRLPLIAGYFLKDDIDLVQQLLFQAIKKDAFEKARERRLGS